MDFNKIALEEAEKSPCKKRKVGAVITQDNKVVASGHNFHPDPIGLPLGSEICEDSKGNTRPGVIHAEISALRELENKAQVGDTIYVTHYPCDNCQRAIDKAGLKVVLVEQFMKFDSGKLRYSLIPQKAMKEMAKVLTYGAKKYKPNNWQQVDDTTRYIDALYRHLEAWRGGEKIDEESKLSHLSHAITNIAFLIHFEDIKD